MNNEFEHHVNELKQQAKKLFKYTFFSGLTLLAVLIFLIIINYKNIGLLLFMGFVSIVLFSESLFGSRMYKNYNWVLNHYKEDKSKCIEILSSRKVNYDNLQVDLTNENLSFSTKFYMHSKRAYDLLKNDEIE